MNVIFLTLDLGAPSAVEVLDTIRHEERDVPGLERVPLRLGGPRRPSAAFDLLVRRQPASARGHARRRVRHPAGSRRAAISRRPGRHGMDRHQRQLSRGTRTVRRPAAPNRYPAPPQRDWGREEVHKDWAIAVKAGKPAPCHFGYAGPFTEAYQLGNIALAHRPSDRMGPAGFPHHQLPGSQPVSAPRISAGWDLKEIAGSAWDVPGRRS